MSITSVQLDKELLENILEIVKNKFPLRKINTYAEATREALYEFIKKNRRYENKQKSPIAKATEEGT